MIIYGEFYLRLNVAKTKDLTRPKFKKKYSPTDSSSEKPLALLLFV